MDQVSKFYRDALANFDKKTRKKEICIVAETLEENLRRRYPSFNLSVSCCMKKMDDAIVSYFYDIYRFKHFHAMLDTEPKQRINYHKVFSFTSKWILKERPFFVEIKENLKECPSELMEIISLINEYVLIGWISFVAKEKLSGSFTLRKEESKKIFYSMKYRDFSTGFFELFLMTKFPSFPPAKNSHS